MQITKHGLKKPKDDTFYDIIDFNYNTDILEEHLDNDQLHVNATDIAKITETTTLSQIDQTDTNVTMWGKVKKAISTLVSHITNVATGSTLGHIKIGTGIQMNGGTASVKLTDSVSVADSTIALSAKAGKSINDSKAPINHASGGIDYGIGTPTAYGHVALSDDYTQSSAASTGHAPSNLALRNAYLAAVGNTWYQAGAGIQSGVRYVKCGRTVIMSGIITLQGNYAANQVAVFGTTKYPTIYTSDILATAVSSSYINTVVGGYVDNDGIHIQFVAAAPSGLQIRVLGVYFTNV